MEELLELKELLLHGEVDRALILVEDLEEMGKKGVARNIRAYAMILLLHLIKQEIERRSTKSWETSIRNSVREIKDLNARPKGRGVYLNDEELNEAIAGAMEGAIDRAAIECCEGIYEGRQIKQLVDQDKLIAQAIKLVLAS